MASSLSSPSQSRNSGYRFKLSAREFEVLSMLVEGKSNPEIASHLYLSTNTIKSHVNGIFNKLGVNDRVQAAVFAVRNQLV
ncbi:response regulator transcription factor [Pseudanabaena catenata USMAC16]|uniref:Transcriptional regulator, LuxR family n=2 Tax=Pseudanabaena TaxID=1152 RepID=L8N5X5_9CYAN|nr:MULTISPECIES: response regulator transcription factor [Pseudanabaena]ELS34105.1 transcriptional regulator, LuxR family [Pseudanabaena biceps PCC 7429]MDG3493694.1 response regulator transcription factor [Pseudanabaena catenata USMAC16]